MINCINLSSPNAVFRFKGGIMTSALVFGLGVSGRKAAKLLIDRGMKVTAVDSRSLLLKTDPEVSLLCEKGLLLLDEKTIDFAKYSFGVLSPGIPFSHPFVCRANEGGLEFIGEIELAFRFLPATAKNPMLGITGTNGKTTVTLLVEHVLKGSGRLARALGNVGVPLIEAVENLAPDETCVIELSSFQLEALKSKSLDAGVILNITPDHLDRYGSMENYAKAKSLLFDAVKQGGKCFADHKTYSEFSKYLPHQVEVYGYDPSLALWSDGKQLFYCGKPAFELPSDLKGRKSHDLENLMAAFALCFSLGVQPVEFLKGYSSFAKPEHRIEYVTEIQGIKFYNDSKGTNIDAVVRAVESLPGPIHLIAGGVHKGAPYTSWKSAFEGKVKSVFAIGEAAKMIQKDLEGTVEVILCEKLEDAVQSAFKIAAFGETILLSPGCSSYDMFKDYEHRGREFKRIVHLLPK
jgi:UDP-N-acetylmuramoylalanine--D-glutamate ligase